MSKNLMTLEETVNTLNIRKGKREIKRFALIAAATAVVTAVVVAASNKIENDTEN